MGIDVRSCLFRAVVLSTLLVVGAIFSVTQYKQTGRPKTDESAGAQCIKVEPPKSFGGKLLDDPVAFFTMALAGLTPVIAGVAAGQIYYLRRMDATARLSADAALKAALAAQNPLMSPKPL